MATERSISSSACKTGLYILYNKGLVAHQSGTVEQLPAATGELSRKRQWETGGRPGAAVQAPPPGKKKQ